MRTIKANGKPMVTGAHVGLSQQKLKIAHAFQAQLTSAIVSRAGLASQLGQSFDDNRKLYDACGYPHTLTYERFKGRFLRQDIAKRIVRAYPDASWRGFPSVYETQDDSRDTQFEKDWDRVLQQVDVFHYLHRADVLAGIGNYSVIFCGFDDRNAKTPDKPVVGKVGKLLYMQPFSQQNAEIKKRYIDTSKKSFNHPEQYELSLTEDSQLATDSTQDSTMKTGKKLVHASRVIHVPSDGLTESDIFGTPRLECVYNRLQDIETIVAGSAEMFWAGAFPGIAFEAASEAELPNEDDLEDEIEDYIQGLTRYLRLQGIQAKQLTPQIESPKEHFAVQIQCVSAGTGIPARIILGTEEARNAGDQDDTHFNDRVQERRESFVEPVIINQLIDKFTDIGLLSPTSEENGHGVDWPDLESLDDRDKAELGKTQISIISEYLKHAGADELLPPMHLLTKIMGYEKEEAEDILKDAMAIVADEEEENKRAEEELERRAAEEERLREEAV